jgi:hypothetical protein
LSNGGDRISEDTISRIARAAKQVFLFTSCLLRSSYRLIASNAIIAFNFQLWIIAQKKHCQAPESPMLAFEILLTNGGVQRGEAPLQVAWGCPPNF